MTVMITEKQEIDRYKDLMERGIAVMEFLGRWSERDYALIKQQSKRIKELNEEVAALKKENAEFKNRF